MSKKVLSGVNLTHKSLGLTRPEIKNYGSLTAVIGNIRSLIYDLGFDCSMLNDQDVLALEDLVHEHEQDLNDDIESQHTSLYDALTFLVVK